MRYLDIIRRIEREGHARTQIDPRSARSATSKTQPSDDEINELNEESVGGLHPGTWVEWNSPLFGRCSGQVAMSPESGWFVVRSHSVTGDLALIHVNWNVRLRLRQPRDGNGYSG